MNKRLLSLIILVIYSAILIKIMVFKDVPMILIGHIMINFGGTQTGPANLLPFRTILAYLLGEKGLMIGGINLIGNIILLIPMGLLLPLVFPKLNWKKTIVLAAAIGFSIEGIQVLLQVGIFDIDDVILNGLGIVAGYWGYQILEKYVPSWRARYAAVTGMLILVVLSVVAFYAIAAYQGSQPMQKLRPVAQGGDPCGGTGGLGAIASIENPIIKIKKGDGTIERVKLTKQTTIRNSAGTISASDLRIGDRATIVTFESDEDGNKIAAVVLVCNEQTGVLR
ncbi:VanZ family protein [Pedobacter sp. JY14-1]|uniref:VanZ family protein n=1 Tax=Pedobacter sp. JY14-1 TaxID=3034151 RepID=UPI0023E0AB70|nr:VanZ family protein [Pedobacter sp. JY14-1]